MAEQVEKSYQKQPLFHNNKVSTTSRKVAGKDRRWYKEVGLGFKTPREAIEGTYIDKKCPFTGLVSIRGRILTGKVVSTKMTRTIVIRREYLHFVPKYSRCKSTLSRFIYSIFPSSRLSTLDSTRHTAALHAHFTYDRQIEERQTRLNEGERERKELTKFRDVEETEELMRL